MRLIKLDRTTRLILISVGLGVVGALGAQLFLLLLHLTDTYVLDFLGRYHVITVAAAHSMGTPPEPFTHWYWWVPIATTLGGLVAGVLIYSLAPETEGHGTDATLVAFHRNNGRMRARAPFVKIIASAITIGSGGSGGREGPTAQIASGIGAIVGSLLKLSDEERRLVMLIGMAAGLSAIFKSPLGTAIFAVEILYSRMAFEGGALIYTLISAAVAYAITGAFSGYTPLFLLPASQRVVQPTDLVWFALLGILAGAIGALLPAVFYRIRDSFRALKIPVYLKPAIGGLAVGLIGIAVPPIIGGGYGYMQFVLQGGTGLARLRSGLQWCIDCSVGRRPRIYSTGAPDDDERSRPTSLVRRYCVTQPCRPRTLSGSPRSDVSTGDPFRVAISLRIAPALPVAGSRRGARADQGSTG